MARAFYRPERYGKTRTMRLVYITAGAAGTHCGACARDAGLVRALIARGHKVLLTPLYTPMEVEGEPPGADRVFLSGIAAWLDQHIPGFRKRKPGGLIDRLFDHPALLRAVARYAIETAPEKLGPMTVSVLRGEDGAQAGEIAKLTAFLEKQPPPDAIHLSNALLLALAPMLRRVFNRPLLCAYQGEEAWIDRLGTPWSEQVRELVRRHAGSVDLFLAPSADAIPSASALFNVPEERIQLLPPCIDTRRFEDVRRKPGPADTLRVGYLSRIVPEKGLADLADAVVLAAREWAVDTKRRIVLRVAGPVPRGQKAYYWSVLDRVRDKAGVVFEYTGDVDFDGKKRFLEQCDVFCIPSTQPERRGMAVLEAMTGGLPVVLPALGVYVEFIQTTGGGVLFEPHDPEDLKKCLVRLGNSPEIRNELAARAARGVREYFSARRAAALYEELLDSLMGKKER